MGGGWNSTLFRVFGESKTKTMDPITRVIENRLVINR